MSEDVTDTTTQTIFRDVQNQFLGVDFETTIQL